jgi:hypothetical protein
MQVYDTKGVYFGDVIDINHSADEVEIVNPDGNHIVVSAASLIATEQPGDFMLAYDIDPRPEEAVDTGVPVGVKHDGGKLDWSLLPVEAIEDVVRVLMHGEQKYSRDNWRRVPDGYNRYLSAHHCGAER